MSDDVRCLPPVPDGERISGRVIDVVVWGASRPDLFEQTIASFRERVKFSGRLRYFLEDGAFDESKAAESARLAQGFGFEGINAERVGSYGWAMTAAMARWVRAPLMFSLEDDWRCLRSIDLDLAWALFQEHHHVNQLRYNRRDNEPEHGGFVYAQRELTVGGRPRSFLGGRHWYFNPSLWRMSYVWPRWRGFKDNIHWGINSPAGFLPPHARVGEQNASPDWYADTLGVLTWGGLGEPAFFEHLGEGRSLRKSQGRV